MEHKSSNFRLFGCFSASVLFHSLLIVGMGFASTVMLLKKGEGDGEGKAIEVAVVGEQAPAPIPEPQVVQQPAPTPAPAVVAKPVAPKKAVAAKKPAVKEIAPLPVVEVNETMNESPVVAQDSDSNAIKPEEVKQEEQPLPEKAVAETQVEEVKAEQVVAAAPVEQAAPPAEPSPTPQAPAAPVAQAQDAGKTEKAGGDAGNATQSAPIATQSAPQNFLNLKQASGNKPPQYSRDMRFNRLEGRGQLQYYVTKTGAVSQLKVTQSSGHAELDKAAVEAFSKYKFVPGQEGYTVHNFEFTLKGPAEADAGRLRTTYK